MFKKLFVTLVILSAMVSAAVMQDTPTPRIEITGVNASDLPTVTVTANVFDSLGQPVRGLTAADFSLQGEIASLGTIVEVANVTDDDLAFSVVLVIDTSSSMSEFPFLAAQEAARVFVNSIGPNDPVAIYDFDTDVVLVQDFTTDKSALLTAIDNITLGGKTALYGASLQGVLTASESGNSRRVVILLSDGAEYGAVSGVLRGDALQEARQRGVAVYTIGLGYGTDRTYLLELAEGTNAQFYESPTPEELLAIYQALADRLRSQYVITLQADLPADGTEYAMGLEVTTAEGTASAEGVLRAPIPVPIVTASELSDAISEVTDLEVIVKADDPIATTSSSLDGTALEATSVTSVGDEVTVPITQTFIYTIDPQTLAPGPHTLEFSATDETGDTGAGSLTFEVAALPSTITLTTNLDVAAGEIAEPLVVTIDVAGQTGVAEATTSVDGDNPSALGGSAPFIVNIDPQLSAPGEHRLTVSVTNEGGVTSTADLSYSVASLPPLIGVNGLDEAQTVSEPVNAQVLVISSQTLTADVIATLNGMEVANVEDAVTVDISIDPMTLPPGDGLVQVIATDGNGNVTQLDVSFVVDTLVPEIIVEGLEAGDTLEENRSITVGANSQTPITSVTATVDGDALEIPAEAPFSAELDVLSVAPGEHTLTVTVETENGQSSTLDVPFTVGEGPSLTATFEAQPTETNTPDVEASGTQAAVEMTEAAETAQAAEAEATNSAQLLEMMTAESISEEDAQATLEAEGTAGAQAALDAQGTSTAIAVFITATAEAQGTASAQEEADSQLTADARATRNADRTATAQAEEATEEVAQAPTDAGTAVEQETEEASATPGDEAVTRTPAATPPDVSTLTAESVEDAPPASNNTPILVIIIVLIVIVVVVYFVLRGGRRNRA